MPEDKNVLATPLESEVTSRNGKCCLQYQGAACAPSYISATPNLTVRGMWTTKHTQSRSPTKSIKGLSKHHAASGLGMERFLMPGVLGTACCRIFR